MPAPISRRAFAKHLIDLAIRKARAATSGKPRRVFAHLLWNVQGRSDLLRPGRLAGRADAESLGRLVFGLLGLVDFRKEWLRPVEDWEPTGAGTIPVFSSLAHHLLARYPVPPVLLSAWFQEPGWRAHWQRSWFHHTGSGGSLRTAGFPIRLTRRMALEFSIAPPHLPIEFALRWAQVRGMGGSDELARAVASTRLGREFHHNEFWMAVIHLFLNASPQDPADVALIVDYLHDQKFEGRRVIIGEGVEVDLDPPRPDLAIKGCTVASLRRRASEWQQERRPEGPERRLLSWEPSGIGEYRCDGGEAGDWTIRELLDSDALAAEGKAMRHCVATYTACCVGGRSTIWSLGREGPAGRRRLLTVEVDPATRSIVQASKKGNAEPDESCRALLRDWAGREGLTM